MQKTRNSKSLKALRELYFNEEKCGIVLIAEKNIDNNVIYSINETRLNLYKYLGF